MNSTMDDSKEIHSTLDNSWYDSTFIEKYMDILLTKSSKIYYFNTSFLHKYIKTGIPGVLRWVKTDILRKKMLFFPVHVDKNHWILIVIDISKKRICHYNSYDHYYENATKVIVNFIRNWQIKDGLTPANYEIVDSPTPEQTNTYDSGPWILHIAKCLVFNKPLDFSESDMPFIRQVQKKEVQYRNIKMFRSKSINYIEEKLILEANKTKKQIKKRKGKK